MKIFVVSTLAVVAFVASAVSGTGQTCCPPDQWQGTYASGIGYSGPNPGYFSNLDQIFYDAANSRVAVNATITGLGNPKRYFIVKRKDKKCEGITMGKLLKDGCGKGKMYVVDLATGKCYIKDRSFKKICVPDGATFAAKFAFGADSDTLDCKAFSLYKADKQGNSMSAWITVTAKACIPVGVTLNGAKNGVGFMEAGGFSNIKLSVDDPSVFDVPAQCKQGAITTELPDGMSALPAALSL